MSKLSGSIADRRVELADYTRLLLNELETFDGGLNDAFKHIANLMQALGDSDTPFGGYFDDLERARLVYHEAGQVAIQALEDMLHATEIRLLRSAKELD